MSEGDVKIEQQSAITAPVSTHERSRVAEGAGRRMQDVEALIVGMATG